MRRKTITIDGVDYKVDKWDNVLVDAYLIPLEDAPAYVRMRERYATIALDLFAKHYPTAQRDYAGSQDGEAVVALDEDGLLVRFFHLDPSTLEEMQQAEENGELEDLLLVWEN